MFHMVNIMYDRPVHIHCPVCLICLEHVHANKQSFRQKKPVKCLDLSSPSLTSVFSYAFYLQVSFAAEV